MASNIDKSTNLTPDVYGINNYVNEMKKKFTPGVNEDTLMLGIFGYTGQMFSDLLQNTIVMASEFSNESIPSKAKFEKNIIAHALGLGITDINAIPSQLDVLLTFVEDDIINWSRAKTADGEELPWEFVFDKDTPIYIGDFCFHTDYDIEIKKVKLPNSGGENDFAYTAKYLIDIDNPISDITNPYLTSPVKMNVNGINIIFTKCTLHQVNKVTMYKKVLSDNSITAKTVTFDFEGQLAAFTIDVTEGNTTTHLVPVYEGLTVENLKYPYFYYSYLDSNTIRIKFDRYSYAPRINSDVRINLQITEGEAGNFIFNPETYPAFSFESEKYEYSNIGCEIRPVTGESLYGSDKKSIEDLKKLIPKEALSRGSITNITDLENFFNMLDTDSSKLYFYKKRDNALERLYYSFILMKDAYNVIIPTNTIDILVYPEQLETENGSNKLIFKKGQMLRLVDNGAILDDSESSTDDSASFKYIIPYNFIINTSPLYGMYFLSIIDSRKFLDFSYINQECLYQYIATNIHCHRGYIENPETYELSVSIEQNVDSKENSPIIKINADGEVEELNIRCVAVFHDENNGDEQWRWGEAKLSGFELDANVFNFKFNFTTDDLIDNYNRIKIEGLYGKGNKNLEQAFFHSNTKCTIHILSKQGQDGSDAVYGASDKERADLEAIIPDLDGYTLSNSYTVIDGVDFFHDYSDIISSTVISELNEDEKPYFRITGVPVVKYDYFDTEDRAIDFCKELITRKNYIDYAIQVLEDAFGMDFKFFNTYGPSKLFTTDNSIDYLNKTNLSLTFRLKLNPNYDTNIINNIISDIKTYIEDINEVKSLHMSNLTTDITEKYRESVVFFEFVDMNGYGPSVQHLYSMEMPDSVIIPEFLNIASRKDGTPDIEIILV